MDKDVLTHLHGHSTFSFQDGYGTPQQLTARLAELGHTCCAITDHGNVFAHVPYYKTFRAAGLKPILGCEMYVVSDHTARTTEIRETGENGNPHVTVLAKNQKGYRNLLKLSKISWSDGFYYKPRVDWNLLAQYQEGLVVLTGCISGWPSRLALKDPQLAFEWVQKWRHRFENFYIEIDPAPCMGEVSARATEHLARIAWELKIPAVVTADAHFPRPGDHAAQDLMQCVGIGKKLTDEREFRTPAYQYYCSGQELLERCRAVAPNVPGWFFWEAIKRTSIVAEECNVEIPKGKPIAFPDVPDGQTSADVLYRWIRDGFVERAPGFQNLLGEDRQGTADRYWNRAMHELKVLKDKNFCDYVLAVTDVCRWMKLQDVLVMLRGSAGGCLILWLMGASEVDSLRHGLSFERFYDTTRDDPPDIDIDFERLQRGKAIEYVYAKYGADHCSQIAALSKLKAKAAVQDICFALGIPRSEYAPLADALESNDEDVDRQLHEVTDAKALQVLEKYPLIATLTPKLIGQYRHQSIHAAGVLVSAEPLENFVGIVMGAEKQPVAAVDKKGAAELGLLKIDFLSVNSLDIVATAVRRLGYPVKWLYTLPLDDAEALTLADTGWLAGIFQLDGGAAASVAKRIGIHSFEDVVAASGLCRPGPSEWVSTYQGYKDNPEELAEYLRHFDPVAQKIIAPTYGILMFQEQVMAMAAEFAGFEVRHVQGLRKGVQDKLGLNPQTGPAWKIEWHARFKAYAQGMGRRDDEIEFWWDSIESHGGYGFNKAHCTTYGIIGYWMLYLKAHHPAAFYEAYLQLDDDPVKMKKLIGEFKAMGGQVDLLDPRYSQASFSSTPDGRLVGGYQNLRGIGPVTATKVVTRKPYDDWDDLFNRGLSAGVAKRIEEARSGGQWDPQKVIVLAPWFPVPRTLPEHAAVREQYGVMTLDQLPKEKSDGNLTVAGYVTVTKFDRDKTIFVLEDEHRPIVVRIARNFASSERGRSFRTLSAGDYICVSGWWTGDVLFAKDFVLLSRGEKGEKEDAGGAAPKELRAAERARKKANAELRGGPFDPRRNGVDKGDRTAGTPGVSEAVGVCEAGEDAEEGVEVCEDRDGRPRDDGSLPSA